MRIKERNRIMVIFVILLLLSSSVQSLSIDSIISFFSRNIIEGLEYHEGFIESVQTGKLGRWFKYAFVHEMDEKFENVRTAAYIIGFFYVTYITTSDISEHIKDYILENPDPLQPGVNSALYLFISILVPFYILAIVSLGVYIIFLSASPRERSMAKSMLAKLLIGMVLLSISPYLLNIFFDLSRIVTENILGQGENEITVAVDTYNDVMWDSFYLSLGIIYGTDAITRIKGYFLTKKRLKEWISRTEFRKEFLGKLKLIGDTGRTIPFLMLTITLILGVYGILAIRYFMVMFFTLLFPFTLFFLCFDPTKKLGGTLLEQLLLWTLVQEFYAITLISVGTGMSLLPSSLLGYGIGWWVFRISFFELAACFTLMLGPIILFMLLRKLLPPL